MNEVQDVLVLGVVNVVLVDVVLGCDACQDLDLGSLRSVDCTLLDLVLRQVTPVSTLSMNRNLAIMPFLPPGLLFSFDRWGSDILASSVNIAVCQVLRPASSFDKEEITS